MLSMKSRFRLAGDGCPSMNRSNKLVVVLGMHRSGTSALARALPVLRVELGDRLMEAVPDDNEKGFWGDRDGYE